MSRKHYFSGHQSFLLLVYYPVNDTLFEVSPDIRCLMCQVAIVVMETTQLALFRVQFKTL